MNYTYLIFKMNGDQSVSILRSDGASIPIDNANRDYQLFITWLSQGGQPTIVTVLPNEQIPIGNGPVPTSIILTDPGDYIIPSDFSGNLYIYVNKTVPAPTKIFFPNSSGQERTVVVKDAKGNSNTYPITCVGSFDMNGNYVINQNYQAMQARETTNWWMVV
jgi:hypothetical protein